MSAALRAAPEPARQPSFPLTVLGRWLPIGVAVTALALFVYAAVQQVHRSGANDPQSQLAEDVARALAHGARPADVVSGPVVDIAASLAPWTMVVDAHDHLLAGSAMLDGRTPALPAGVLDVARRHGGNGVTWQPRPGVRSATVEVAVPGGNGWVVIAGRSLREVEIRERRLELLTLLAWSAAMVTTLIATAIGAALAREG